MTRFHVSIEGAWSLEVDEIWPDGDAPDNPTVDDVRKVMPSHVNRLITDWNLVPEVTVTARRRPRQTGGRDMSSYALFAGANLAVEFRDAEDALSYMARNADDLADGEAALVVFDGEGRAQIALVDARAALAVIDERDGGDERKGASAS